MAKQTFTTWLGKQEHRQDPVGHLARVWAEFTPGRISSVAGVNRVLREIAERAPDGPVPAALEAMTAAVGEYEHRDDPRPPLAAVPDQPTVTAVMSGTYRMTDAGPGRADDEGAEPPFVPMAHDAQGHPAGPSLPAHDAQGRYDGASALAHQRINPIRWQVTSAPQGTLEAISDTATRVLGIVSLIGHTLGITPEDAAGAVGYAGARDIAPHLPAVRRALEFALSVARPEHAGEYSGALAALFPADYGTQDPDMLADLEQATAPPAPDDFAGLWAAADFSEADR